MTFQVGLGVAGSVGVAVTILGLLCAVAGGGKDLNAATKPTIAVTSVAIALSTLAVVEHPLFEV